MRVMIADDHPLFAEALENLLHTDLKRARILLLPVSKPAFYRNFSRIMQREATMRMN